MTRGLPSPGQRALIWTICQYQRTRVGRPPRCRFEPSCSHYAQGAIAEHGAWRGTGLALRRLARCHPWGGHGFDPVPDLSGEMVLYCGGGFRSALAADNLQKMGYTNVLSMDGGIREWREKGFPLTKD